MKVEAIQGKKEIEQQAANESVNLEEEEDGRCNLLDLGLENCHRSPHGGRQSIYDLLLSKYPR